MERSGPFPAFEADWPHLGQTVMINHASAPGPLDTFARRWNVASRFTCQDEDPDGALREVGQAVPGFCRDLGETQGVCRGEAQNGRRERIDQAQSSLARHPSGRNAMGTYLASRFECGPESEERAEGKREQNSIGPVHSCRAVDGLPAF